MIKASGLTRVFKLFSHLFLLALVLTSALALRAQEVTAAINGVVTDPSGAAVAGAKVTAKDLDRGSSFPTTADGSGFYNLPRLPVGRYEVRVENAGFQAAVKPEVVLQLNQNAKIDFALQVGNVNQTVEVTTDAPILQTQATQLGTVLDAKTNAQLPLATRNYVQLTLLAPGTVTTDPSSFTGAQSSFGLDELVLGLEVVVDVSERGRRPPGRCPRALSSRPPARAVPGSRRPPAAHACRVSILLSGRGRPSLSQSSQS